MIEKYSIWNMYGLKDNPFNTDPLTAYATELPIKQSFFGRAAEVEKIKKLVYSNKSSRILVYGDVGVGKTTLVNYVKYALSDYFTPLAELSIQYTWTPEEFMYNTISTIYTTIDRTETIKEKINDKLIQKWSVIFDINRGQSYGGGLNIGGLGGSIESSRTYGVPQFNSTNLKVFLQEMLDELVRIGYKGTILHFNNLELIQDKGENQLKRIMNGIRDFLQVRNAHFIFVSDEKLYEIFQQTPRVEDIFKVPIMLKPFDFNETKEVIDKRLDLLKIPQVNPIKPFDDDALKILFELYSGNLRGTLRSLDCAINEAAQSRPIVITAPILKTTLFKFSKNRFLSRFPKEDSNTIKILKRILEKRETTNKLLAEHLKMLPQNVSASLTKLRETGTIRLSREEGRSRYYVPSQEALWLLLEPAPEWEGQTQLQN